MALMHGRFLQLCAQIPWCRADVIESVLILAHEIAQDAGEGQPMGALFTIGRASDVLRLSRPLILNPLLGHPPEATHVTNPDLRGTVKELAQLDGAFVVADEGTVVAACRYLDIPSADVRIPLGLGSRHVAAASISKRLGVVAIAVSQSGTVRAFLEGELVFESSG